MAICNSTRYNGFQQDQLELELAGLKNYLQNASLGMTAETYLDMCEQLGTTPIRGDIPVSYNDLTEQSRLALQSFEYCMDKWDHMSGRYLGKDISNIEFVFRLLDISRSDWSIILILLLHIISIKTESINRKK